MVNVTNISCKICNIACASLVSYISKGYHIETAGCLCVWYMYEYSWDFSFPMSYLIDINIRTLINH